MEPWHWWLIASIVLVIFEIFFSDFLLATLGAACVAAAVAAGFGAEFIGQFGTFIVASILALALLRPAMKRWMYQTSDPLKTGSHALLGQRGTVTETVGGPEAVGRVKIGGEEWRALSEDGAVIEPGCIVEILSLDSATLTVKPRTQNP